MWSWVNVMKPLAIIAALLMLSSCGFTPVYGTASDAHTPVAAQLSQIYINNIPNREGQVLRNRLIDRFYRTGRPAAPDYTLSVRNLREQKIDLDITKTSDSTRAQLRVEGTLELRNKASDEILLQRNLRTITSYNILGSEFATRITESDARENALKAIAEQIEIQLGLYFNR